MITVGLGRAGQAGGTGDIFFGWLLQQVKKQENESGFGRRSGPIYEHRKTFCDMNTMPARKEGPQSAACLISPFLGFEGQDQKK